MNFQFYLEKLSDSPEFEKFKSKNKDAYLCSGFFSIDKQGKDNQQHLDFYIPSKKKMFSFQMEKHFEPSLLDDFNFNVPEKLNEQIDFEFNEIEKMILKKMKAENVNSQIHKLLLSLQNLKGKHFIVGTIFISGLGILKTTIDLEENKIMDFEKKSFFDMMKIIKK